MTPETRSDSPASGTVLVVDDDPALNQLVALHLGKWGHRALRAHGETEMWRCLEEEAERQAASDDPQGIELVLLDVHLGSSDGSRLVEQIRRRWPSVAIVMVTRSSSLEIAIRSLRSGASDYLLKPIDFDHLERAVNSALESSRLRRRLGGENAAIAQTAPVQVDRQDSLGILGRSPAIERVREILRRVAPTQVPALVLGETGTGKELAARALHDLSLRSEGPFVAVNAAAIPRELIESELFGHEKGAFTGATERRIGLCERANGGTLFLDEIAEMEPGVQAKLLRFLQDGGVQRVGANDPHPVDVRVIAATNRDPQSSIASGRLREDLYYRLRGVQLTLPPLRERGDDVLLLANEFLRRAAERLDRRLEWSAEASEELAAATWPGNVRQLLRLVDEVALLAEGPSVNRQDLPADLIDAPPSHAPSATRAEPEPREMLPDHLVAERQRIAEALLRHPSPDEIASALGMSRATLYRKMKRYGLRRVR